MKEIKGPSYLVAVAKPNPHPPRLGQSKYFWYGPFEKTGAGNIWRSHTPWPKSLRSLHPFLVELSREKGIELPAIFGLTRNHGRREARGFKGVGIFKVSEDRIVVEKSFAGVKGIPGTHQWAQPDWKQREGFAPIHPEGGAAEPLDSTYRAEKLAPMLTA